MAFCIKCGKKIENLNKFCPYCGEALPSEAYAFVKSPATLAEESACAEPAQEATCQATEAPVSDAPEASACQEPSYTQPAVAVADNNAPEVNRFNTPALMGMIFGTVSITSATLGLIFSDLFFWVMAFMGIPAVILGIIGLTRPGYKPMSIVGVITGTLGSLYPALFIIILFTLLFMALFGIGIYPN